MPEDFLWAIRTLPRIRLVSYVLYLLAGGLLAVYQPPSIRDLSLLAQSLFHVVLLLGGLAAVVGVAARRERIEQAGLVVIMGPLCAYSGILFVLALGQPMPGRFATLAISLLFLAPVGFVMAAVLDIRRQLQRAAAARARGEQWGR